MPWQKIRMLDPSDTHQTLPFYFSACAAKTHHKIKLVSR
jgi:hypothetical protein